MSTDKEALLNLGWSITRDSTFRGNDYMIAKDIIVDDKKKSMFKSIKSYELDDDIALARDNVNNNLYEVSTMRNGVCREIQKIHFDIDEWKKTPITMEQFNIELDKLLNIISIKLTINGIDLTREDVVVIMNSDYETNNVKSVHLVLNNYSMNYIKQKQLVENINFILMNNEETYLLDDSVYKPHQQFKLPNQSKIQTKINVIPTTQIIISDHNFNDALVNDTTRSTELIYNEELSDIKQEAEASHARTQIKLTPKTFMKFVKYIPKHSKLWNSSHNWKMLTWIIIKLKLCDMTKWEELSRTKATREYTKRDNDIYIQDLTDTIEDCNAGKCKLEKILTEHSIDNKYYFVLDMRFTQGLDELKLYLSNHENLNIDYDSLKESMTKTQPILYNDEYTINLKSGMITDVSNNKRINFKYGKIEQLPIYNFKTINIKHITEATEIQPNKEQSYLNEFLDGDGKMLVVISDCGTGKTYCISNRVIEWGLNLAKSILDLTCINSINTKSYMDNKEYDAMSHLKHKADRMKEGLKPFHLYNFIVCSIQSLWKTLTFKPNIVISDETMTSMSVYAGEQFKKRESAPKAYKRFCDKIKTSQKTLLLDADMDEEVIMQIANASKIKPQDITIINNSQNEYSDYDYIIHDNKDTFEDLIESKLEANKKVVIASATRGWAELIYNGLIKAYPNKRIVKCDKFGIVNNYGVKHEKQHFIGNMENVCVYEDKVDVVIYTPTISVGISINVKDYFDCCFGFCSANTLNAYQTRQQLIRVRHLLDKEVNIYVNKSSFSGRSRLTHAETKYHHTNKTHLYNSFYEEHFNIHTDADADYIESYTYQQTIKLNSLNCFARELIACFAQHGNKYSFSDATNKDKILECVEVIEDVVETRMEQLDKSELMDYFEYLKMERINSNKKEEGKNVEEDLSFVKTDLMYKSHLSTYNKDKHTYPTYTSLNYFNQVETFCETFVYAINLIDINNVDCRNDINRMLTDYYGGGRASELEFLRTEIYTCKQLYNLYMECGDHDFNETDTKTTELINANNMKELDILMILICKMIDFNFKYFEMSNKRFYEYIENNSELFISINKLIQETHNKSKTTQFIQWIHSFNSNDVKKTDLIYIKSLYTSVKQLFKRYDITMKYKDDSHHTDRPNTMITIYTDDKIVRYPFQKSFKECKTFSVEALEKYTSSRIIKGGTSHNTFKNVIMRQRRKNAVPRYYNVMDGIETEIYSSGNYDEYDNNNNFISTKPILRAYKPHINAKLQTYKDAVANDCIDYEFVRRKWEYVNEQICKLGRVFKINKKIDIEYLSFITSYEGVRNGFTKCCKPTLYKKDAFYVEVNISDTNYNHYNNRQYDDGRDYVKYEDGVIEYDADDVDDVDDDTDDVDDVDDDTDDMDEYDDEDGDGGYIKKPEPFDSYYDRTCKHIDDLDAERTKKQKQTLAYLHV